MVTVAGPFHRWDPAPEDPKYSQISLAIQAGVSAALSTGSVQSNLASTKSQVEQIIG